ncbi:Interleukin-1 receptor type 1 [Merluccius polli]|uniref:Interleukin-1 receptor type 1 n=1 Tax=Merluccius polli TaxID=89951 RepID=A0AA47NVK0_MERPO|nr:Interleukin-1 receptor type 1 [Merluccius polli]
MSCGRLVVLSLVAVLWPYPLLHGRRGPLETYPVIVGQFFLLKCSPGATNVTWSKRGQGHPSLPAGVEEKGRHLWFLPVAETHNGTYVCHIRYQAAYILQAIDKAQGPPSERAYEVWVSHGKCPAAVESRQMNGAVPCKLKHPQGRNATVHVQWLKECVSVDMEGGHVDVTPKGALMILKPSEGDAGLYTCWLNFSLGGHNYTAARSINLTLGTETGLYAPEWVYPKEKIFVVELGNEEKDGHVYGVSSLVISTVVSELLDVPIICHFINPAGQGQGTVWLHRADHGDLYVCVLVPLFLCLVGLALALGWLFRMELVLAYRRLRGLLISQQVSDGKLYDAYVSYLYSSGGGSSEVVTFALTVLPEVLEKQHGFRLFIRGRDDCPGEALHDVIAGMVSMSRRLVLILSAQSDSDTSPLHPSQSQLAYEHSVGLYDALTQGGLRVILVEIDGPVDYAALPESLRYIQRTQGALRWRGASSGNHTRTKLAANRTFWKHLRYHMPPAPQAQPPSSSERSSSKTEDMIIGFRRPPSATSLQAGFLEK